MSMYFGIHNEAILIKQAGMSKTYYIERKHPKRVYCALLNQFSLPKKHFQAETIVHD